MQGYSHQTNPDPADSLPDLQSAVLRIDELSKRERQVLHLLATGGTNHYIAHRLGVSEGTIKSHVGRILQKLELESRTAAAVAAVLYLSSLQCNPGVTGSGHPDQTGEPCYGLRTSLTCSPAWCRCPGRGVG